MTNHNNRYPRLTLPVLLCWLLAAVNAHAYSTSPTGYTGAPTQSQNCISCHSGSAVNTTGVTLAFSPAVTEYEPGRQYNVTVTIPDSIKTRFGFSMVARRNSSTTTTLGTLAAGNADTQVLGDSHVGNLGVPTNTGSHTFTVKWTAPAAGQGAVIFYLSAVASAAAGSSDDFAYTKTLVTNEKLNVAPVVNATATSPITLPSFSSLDGTVSDDGLPNPPAAFTRIWTKVSGPGTVTFANASAEDTTATFSTAGTYVLQLTASDSLLSANKQVTIVVNPQPPTNQSPSVNATATSPITLANSSVLDGTVSDDGLPNPPGAVTRAWTKVSGPGTVTFVNASLADTTATFSAAGTYVLQLAVSDSLLIATKQVTIVVNPVNQPPTVIATATSPITPPNPSVLDGTVTDDGLPSPPGTVTSTWTQVSGPGTVTFANASAADTTATFSTGGTYVLQLTASDSVLSANQQVTVAVDPVVSSTSDSGAGSLREAVAAATSGATITFAPGMDGKTIILGGSQILLNKNLTIDASTLIHGVTVSGNKLSRVFEIASGATVTLRGLALSQGNATGNGGGVLNNGSLTVSNCTISGNSATGNGGGIYSNTDLSVITTTLTNCTLTENKALAGGAIYNVDGRTVLDHCSITANTAQASSGGGVASYGDTATATDVKASIISANSGGDVDLVPQVNNNSFSSTGFNLIGTGSATGDFNQTGDTIGISTPLLGPLCDNGGPTKTMHPLPGSRALDGGGATALTLDQRGLPRTVGSASDIGAVESGSNVRWASRVLGFSSEYSSSSYGATQALGEPDSYPGHGDFPTAWASTTEDFQKEFIILGYDNFTPISAVSVYETFNPGAVDEIFVRNAITRQWVSVWKGTAAAAGFTARIFTKTFPTTSFPVDGVRLDLNSPAVPGWNEIDAVSITPASSFVAQAGLDAAFAARTILSNTVSSGGKLVPATVSTTSNGSPAIWQWTPAADGWYDINTFGSNFDTQLSAYEGTAANSLVWFAGNDDAFPGEFAADHAEPNRSAILLPFYAGKTYQFAISGGSAGAAGGLLRLTIRAASEPLPPAIETRTHPFNFPSVEYNAATALINTIVPIIPFAGFGTPEPYVQVVDTRSAVWKTVSNGDVTAQPFLGVGFNIRSKDAHKLSSQPRLSSAVPGGFKNPPSDSGPFITVVSARYPHPFGGGHRAICTDLRAEGGQGSGFTQMPSITFGDEPADIAPNQGKLRIDFQGFPSGNSSYGYTLKDSGGNPIKSAAGSAAEQPVPLDPGSYSISLNKIAGYRIVVAYEGDGTPGQRIPNIVEDGNQLVNARRQLVTIFPNSIDGTHIGPPNFITKPFLAVSELMVKSDMDTVINVKFVELANGTDKIGYVDVTEPALGFLQQEDVGVNSLGQIVKATVESAILDVTNAAQMKVLVMDPEDSVPLGRRVSWKKADSWITFRNFVSTGDTTCFDCHHHSFDGLKNTIDPVDGLNKIAGGKPRVPWFRTDQTIPKTQPFETRIVPVDAEPYVLGIIDSPIVNLLNHRMPINIAANTGAPRRTTVQYADRTWMIQQAAGSGYVHKIAISGGNQITLTPGTPSQSVSFSATIGWAATVEPDSPWIRVTGTASGAASGSAVIKLSFDPNPSGRPRFGTVKIGDIYLTVIQPIEPPQITSTLPLASPRRGIRFNLKATNGATYSLEYSDTLGSGTWVKQSNVPEQVGDRGLNADLTFDAEFPAQPAKRFYRIKSTPAE